MPVSGDNALPNDIGTLQTVVKWKKNIIIWENIHDSKLSEVFIELAVFETYSGHQR